MSVTVRFFVNEEDRITIVNNSFLKILANINKFDTNTSYFSWISRIAHNEIIDNYRKEKKYRNLFSFDGLEEENEPFEIENEYEGEFSEEELLEMVNILPKASRVVFSMYAIEGDYTYKDIAEVLEVSVETVKWHLKSARKQLKIMINSYEIKRQRHRSVI